MFKAASIFVVLCIACASSTPSISQAQRARAQSLKAAGEVEASAALYAEEVCRSQDPNDSAAMARQWADMWDAAGRTELAEGALHTCELPRVAKLYVASLQAGSMANWQRADTLLAGAQAIDDQPAGWRAEVALRRATVALHLGQTEAAAQYLDEAQAAAPARADIYLVAGQARLAQGDYDGAVAALRPLLSLSPSETDLERARQIVSAAVEESQPPMSPADTAAIRDMLALLTQETLTQDDLAHALSVSQARALPRMRTVAALVAFKSGNAEQGVDLLLTAQSQSPLDPDPPRLIGLHYVADNMPDAALGPLVEAAHRNPFDPEIQVAIAQLASVVGDLRLAHASYQTLVILRPDMPMFQEERDRVAQKMLSEERRDAALEKESVKD